MKKDAFSILELSIVLIIIGLLTAGVIKGGAMIKSSRLAGARALTIGSEVAKIDGLLAWYETSIQQSIAAEQSVDGANVSAWADISPGSISMQKNILTRTPSSDVTYVADGINNIPSIRFINNGHFNLSQLYQGPSAPITIFMVFRPETNTHMVTMSIFDAASGQDNFSMALQTSDFTINAGASTNLDTNFINGQNCIVATYFNFNNSAVYTFDAENTVGMIVNTGSNTLNGLTIGSDKDGNSGFTGLISEIIIYNRPLKINERKDVMRYLSKKYKINVSGI